jgi:hypothetical protein
LQLAKFHQQREILTYRCQRAISWSRMEKDLGRCTLLQRLYQSVFAYSFNAGVTHLQDRSRRQPSTPGSRCASTPRPRPRRTSPRTTRTVSRTPGRSCDHLSCPTPRRCPPSRRTCELRTAWYASTCADQDDARTGIASGLVFPTEPRFTKLSSS